MLLANPNGIAWSTFPKPGASDADQIAAQLDICDTLTSTMDTLASMTLRASLDVEQEWGPDFAITVMPNGWTRFRLSSYPILWVTEASYSLAAGSPRWNSIPTDAVLLEHTGLPLTGTIIPSGTAAAPVAVLIAPGYVGWGAGRKGYLVRVQAITGYPVAGIDEPAEDGDVALHVDDITGWYDGTAGARGVIYDPPLRESVTVAGTTPDVPGAISGPGTLALTAPLQFDHRPLVGLGNKPDQKIVLSTMPPALIQAGYYLATHYGLIRGATAATMQSGRSQVSTGGMGAAQDWYDRAERTLSRYGRVW